MTKNTDPRAKHVPELWAQPITDWSDWLVAGGQSPGTIATRTHHLRRAARSLQQSPWTISEQRLVEWVAQQDWSLETRRSCYASLRLFWEWALGIGAVQASPAANLPSVIVPRPYPRSCPDQVIEAALVTADSRVRLMIRLGAELGLRRAEISQVHVTDLYQAVDGWMLKVVGRGQRVRLLPTTDGLAHAIRVECGRNSGGFAFPGQIDGHLSAAYVGKLLASHLPDQWTGHNLRYRFGTATFTQVQDGVTVSRFPGHASVGTIQPYVPTDAERLRAVAATAASSP